MVKRHPLTFSRCQRPIAPGTPIQSLELRVAEHAAVDLTHAVFEVDPIAGFVEVCHFAILGRGNAQSACKLAYGVEHRIIFRLAAVLALKYDFPDLFTNARAATQRCTQRMTTIFSVVVLAK